VDKVIVEGNVYKLNKFQAPSTNYQTIFKFIKPVEIKFAKIFEVIN